MRCLERQGKATQHNRKTKQHNTTRPKQFFFKEKLSNMRAVKGLGDKGSNLLSNAEGLSVDPGL